MKRIYLDNAASTSVDERVVDAMAPYWNDNYGNAGGIHLEGVTAKKAIKDVRDNLAKYINAHSDEVIFTSGGTEGNNMAILGVVRELENKGMLINEMHLITTTIEHSSVLEIFQYLEELGAKVSYIGVPENGVVNVQDIENEIKDNTMLISVMMANNEIGTVQPVEEIGKAIVSINKNRNTPIYFHVDASQAGLFFKINTNELHADFITFDGQKVYGPKGVGFLYKKREVSIQPLFIGGNQEFGLRPGTPNTPLIVGLGKAFEILEEEREENNKKMIELRDYFIKQLEELGMKINGDKVKRIPSNINVSFVGHDGEFIVVTLDSKGIACSTRSACIGDSKDGSYVVRELGKSKEEYTSSVRFTLSKDTKRKDIDYVVRMVKEIL